MPERWVLTDVAKDVGLREFEAPAADLPRGCGLKLRTHSGGLRDGVQTLEMIAGDYRVTIIPTRGMGIWRIESAAGRLGWNSPVKGGPVHPAYVPVEKPDGLGWLVGFDELLVRCGLESNGAPEFDDSGRLRYPLHGRIANRPAHKLRCGFDPATKELVVRGEVDDTRLFFQKARLSVEYRVPAAGGTIRIVDEIENLAGTPTTVQMLYHVNFGPPLCAPGARVSLPVAQVSPRNSHAAKDIGH
ncbi:MAG TPA: DUF4432 family protein, partial [Planctomycetia bacterium]|nr:DUF4432 family protein [Planctomycetia bacterium]